MKYVQPCAGHVLTVSQPCPKPLTSYLVNDIPHGMSDTRTLHPQAVSVLPWADISSLKSFFYGQFHTKDLGMLKYFLGVKVMRRKCEIFLSQRKYVLDLLSKTGKLAAKPC